MKSLPPDIDVRYERRKPLGPWHDFWLVRSDASTDYRDFVGRPDAPVRLSDDILMSAIGFSQKWLKTTNPASKRRGANAGFNMYGPSIVKGRDGERMQRIFSAWADLCECGPRTIELRGRIGFETRRGKTWCVVDVLVADRHALVRDFRTLAKFGARVAKGRHEILHIGI